MKAIRLAIWTALVLALGTILFALVNHTLRRGATANQNPDDLDFALAAHRDLPVMFEVPAFSFPDQHRRPTTAQDLHGHVWISDFVFTQCTTLCPMMTAKMVLLQRRLSNPELRFVSFSVDPDHDTPDVLRDYAARWNAHESRWLLFSTTYSTLYETVAGMKLSVAKSVNPDNPILHSNLFQLVDQNGHVRGVYNSSDDVDLKQLAVDARELLGNPSPTCNLAPQTAALSPADLYASLGCAACHNQPKLAPPLAGIFGRLVKLESGQTITADQSYLRESILDPSAKIVAGYGLLMPSYRGHLTEQQLAGLVDYLTTLPASAEALSHDAPSSMSATVAPSTQAAVLVIDPVCRMEMRTTANTLHETHDGKTFYFCSDACHDRFVKDPARFATPTATSPH